MFLFSSQIFKKEGGLFFKIYTPAVEGSPRLGAYSLQGTSVVYKSAPQGNPEELFTSDVDSRIPETRGRRTGPLVPIEEIAVDRLSLTLGDLLQEGTFGRIYQVAYLSPWSFWTLALAGYISGIHPLALR